MLISFSKVKWIEFFFFKTTSWLECLWCLSCKIHLFLGPCIACSVLSRFFIYLNSSCLQGRWETCLFCWKDGVCPGLLFFKESKGRRSWLKQAPMPASRGTLNLLVTLRHFSILSSTYRLLQSDTPAYESAYLSVFPAKAPQTHQVRSSHKEL